MSLFWSWLVVLTEAWKKKTIDGARIRWIRKTRRFIQNLGGVLYFSDLLKPQEKTDFRGVPNIQKTCAVSGVFMAPILAYFEYVENYGKTPKSNTAIITAIARLYFGHNNIFGSFGQFRWNRKFRKRENIGQNLQIWCFLLFWHK